MNLHFLKKIALVLIRFSSSADHRKIPGVDMVFLKSRFVRVVVRNNGPAQAMARANTTFDGDLLSYHNPSNGIVTIPVNETRNFDFTFFPDKLGNLAVSTEGEVIN